MRKIFNVLILILFLVAFIKVYNVQAKKSFFCKGLHYTGKGMQTGYERGLMKITKIPYYKLTCKKCHVKNCDVCHAKKEGKIWKYSVFEAKKNKTCVKCHRRAKVAALLAKKQGIKDVHFSKGIMCGDCHRGSDVHGKGISYKSMLEPGAVEASCSQCHTEVQLEKVSAHKVHKGKLDCLACHVANSIACLNCHFNYRAHKKGNFFPYLNFLLLVNHNGKVTAGTAMTIVYNGKKFIVYAPYFTHVITKGRSCKDCHGNEAVKLITQGKKVPMFTYKKGKAKTWKGVVPVVKGKLEWIYLDKKSVKGPWIPLNTTPTSVQWWYCKPLTKEQLKKLSMRHDNIN